MSVIRKEVLRYIDRLPDAKLEALKPLLTILVDEDIVVETNITEEEAQIIAEGRAEYKAGKFTPLDSI